MPKDETKDVKTHNVCIWRQKDELCPVPNDTFSFLPPPSHDAEIERVLNALAAGSTDPSALETEGVDLKEEAGRRAGAEVLPGQPRA